MTNKKMITIILITIIVAFAIISYFILPQQVLVQFSFGSANSYTSKLLSITIASALGIAGAVGWLATNDEKTSNKSLILYVVGIVLFVLMIIFNCFIK